MALSRPLKEDRLSRCDVLAQVVSQAPQHFRKSRREDEIHLIRWGVESASDRRLIISQLSTDRTVDGLDENWLA